jgi:hypothetical protein
MVVAIAILISCSSANSAELSRESCRAADDPNTLADCFEKRVYDACDDAGGSIGDVRCVVSRKRVAERRIDRATAELAMRSKASGIVKRASVNERGEHQAARDHTVAANELWHEYVWEHCLLLNELYSVGLSSGERLGFCQARLTEERADLLERILAGTQQQEQ